MDAQIKENVFKRVLWLYGLYSLLNMFSFLLGYLFLPEGFMRASPYAAIGSLVASASSFWSEFSLTLLFNLGTVLVVGVFTNLQQFRRVPIGYLVPIVLGIVSGLVSGTNSFAASDLKQFDALEGMALGMGIGGIEMLAYVLVIAGTANIGLYNYESLKQWQGEKLKNLDTVASLPTEMCSKLKF